MTKPKMTYESRVEQVKKIIKEEPRRALREVGKFLVKEIKAKVVKSKKIRVYYKDGRKITVKPGRLKKSIGYWYRKRDGDLQVGSKAFYAKWLEFGSSKNIKKPFLVSAVMQNVDVIQDFIKDALKELKNK